MSVDLHRGTWSTCHTYDDGGPILAVVTGSAHLAVSAPKRKSLTEADVREAQALLSAVTKFARDTQAKYEAQYEAQYAEAQRAPAGTAWEAHDDPEVNLGSDEPVPFVPIASVGGRR